MAKVQSWSKQVEGFCSRLHHSPAFHPCSPAKPPEEHSPAMLDGSSHTSASIYLRLPLKGQAVGDSHSFPISQRRVPSLEAVRLRFSVHLWSFLVCVLANAYLFFFALLDEQIETICPSDLHTFPVILGTPCRSGALTGGAGQYDDQKSGLSGTGGFPGTLDFQC